MDKPLSTSPNLKGRSDARADQDPSPVSAGHRRPGRRIRFRGRARRGQALPTGQEKLAIDGGTPVRKTALHSRPYGPQFYDDVEKQELLEVLESKYPFRWWGGKSKVLQFEKAYAAHIGVKYAVAVTSGTTALYTAMAAIGIGPGDEVILPAWTWYADYDAVVLSGALPVFAEIDESFAIDPAGHRSADHAADQGDRALPPPGRRGRHGRDPRHRPAAQAAAWWKTVPNAPADATRGNTWARSATWASTASSSARPSPPAKAGP